MEAIYMLYIITKKQNNLFELTSYNETKKVTRQS